MLGAVWEAISAQYFVLYFVGRAIEALIEQMNNYIQAVTVEQEIFAYRQFACMKFSQIFVSWDS